MIHFLAGSWLAVLAGFVLDLIFGDPSTPLHPIALIGRLIKGLETVIRKIFPATERGEYAGGALLVVLVILISGGIPILLLALFYQLAFWLGVAVEAVLCYFLVAARSLQKESSNVMEVLKREGLEAGRHALSRIVGRDTGTLSEQGITRAAVETVAENFSDGVFAPLFYMMIGGAGLGFIYKCINTMDSMVGYKNEQYIRFGYFAAKLDDGANYIPSRLAALLLILAAPLVHLDGRNAYRIWRRDRRNHASPNSAQTESAAAGALHVRLAGDAFYFGKLYKKPFIGDNDRTIVPEDVKSMNRLMLAASVLSLLFLSVLKGLLSGILLLLTQV